MPRGKIYENSTRAIGDTPMIQINRLVPEGGATVFAKCEFFQPLNSVKDRIGVAMIEAGERPLTADVLERVAKALECEPEDLLSERRKIA